MSTLVKSLPYRGDVTAAAGAGDVLAFVTDHPEGQPTALYRLDPDKLTLQTMALPKGGTALCPDGADWWVGGSDGFLYRCPAKGAPVALGEKLSANPVAIAPVAGDRLAVVAGTRLTLYTRTDGKQLQGFDLPEEGTCLSVDGSGHWLVVGTAGGTVAVFESERQDEFAPAESAKLHDGRVTALSFEPDDLRFLSAGTDNKLLSTYARGKLEPEDRGRGNNHSEPVTAIVRGPARFYTGGRDSTVKAWPKGVGTRPVTHKDGVAKVLTLALVEIGRKPFLAVGCEDNSFRFFEVDDEGKPGEMSRRANDALALARYELSQSEGAVREAGLKKLVGFGDIASLELIAEQMNKDTDHALRLLAVNLLGQSSHPRVVPLLEKALNHNDEAVRVAAFKAMRRPHGEQALRPIELALKTNKPDIGRLAVAALEGLAGRDDQAMARLTEAINAPSFDVRRAALFTLEKVYPDDSPEADLVALASTHADVRRLALVRLFQRAMLDDSQVQAALRRREEDADPAVRQTAFLLTLFTRGKLAPTLRKIDPDLDRQLGDLEGIGPDGTPAAQPKTADPPKAADAAPEIAGQMETIASKRKRVNLDPADYEPLLQATASRSLDTCLRGARGLAVLGDPRAFGLLLQLSREDDKAARAEVCRALAALDDPRAVNRLRSLLFDPEASVRDAAFTALVQIHQDDPLLGAEAGLSAAAEDVRRRGLHSLVAALRANPPKREDPAVALMLRALNDAAPGVRGEAFKAALNLKLGGGGAGTIRFTLRSVHADVRREALTEVMAQVNDDWAWPLLLEFFNDPDPKLRDEAFEFATKKNKEVELLQTALGSRYVDVRKKAVEGLIKKGSDAAQKLLVTALADPERDVRGLALLALIDADARPALVNALAASHDDIRVRAAQALAKYGDPAALPVLRELVTRPKPDQKERVADWADLVSNALIGLGDLGDESTLPEVLAAAESTEPTVRFTAPLALVGLARPALLDRMRPLLQHADPHVKYTSALAMAVAGDVQAAPLVFAPEASMLTDAARLAAALALGPAGEDRLVAFLDSPDDSLRQRALLVLMLLELTSGTGEPTRCLACLASKNPRARLTAARAVESFADAKAFEEFVVGLFNDRGDSPAWKVPAEVVRDVANLLAFGSAQTRYRTVQLLGTLSEKEQHAWDQAWAAHARRFVTEIQTLRSTAPKPAARRVDADQLRQLAFGAYVGLVREQGGSGGTGSAVIRVRQTAMSRILALAKEDKGYAEPARPVLVQALGDPNQPVRFQAFEQLQALGMDATDLGAEALASGHTDLGVKGLELVTDGTSKKEGDKALEDAMLSRTDALALEAAKLLAARRGKVPTAERALTAAGESLRKEAVSWLAAEYDKDAAAQKALRQALTSRYEAVRRSAAVELAWKKDPQSFDALVRVLKEAADATGQRQAINALAELGDKRAPAVLLDRIEDDPAKTALTDELLAVAGDFRQPETADRVLGLGDKGVSWNKVYAAVHTIGGFDQPVEDPEDENPDKKWEKDQHPRHDAVLAKLMDRALRNGHTNQLAERIDDARWSRGSAVDGVLAQLTNLSDEDLRNAAVQAIGWRVRKRNANPEPLLKALRHKDPNTQFLAAEGLARAKRAEGINVLLAAVEYLEDVSLRRRAVLALGELADKRAVDLLLRLANESGHALQDAAAEAIGHLGKAADAGEVLKILTKYAKGTDSLAAAAIRGLRWLNTREGWDVVRQRALDPAYWDRENAVEALGHNDTPETRDALAKVLAGSAEEQSWVFSAAVRALRKLYGEASLEPDFLILKSGAAPGSASEVGDALTRVCKSGSAARMLEILPACHPEVQDELAVALQSRTDLSADQLVGALTADDPRSVELAAHLLGRQSPVPKAAATALPASVAKWSEAWVRRRAEMLRANRTSDEDLDKLTRTLETLLWTAGKAGAKADFFASLIEARPDDPLYRPVRLAALHALTAGPVPDSAVPLLERLAVGSDASARVTAAEALARTNAAKAAGVAEKALSDRTEFNRLAARPDVPVGDVLRKAAGDQHYQGVALPHLIARKDFDTLAAVATNAKLPEATRLGAVEGLAALAEERAEAKLLEIGQREKEPEDVRKAAWRGLRRSRRARQRS